MRGQHICWGGGGVRGVRLAGASLALGYLVGCNAVFGDFSRPNPANCMVQPALCKASQVCNPVTQLCELRDAGTSDASADGGPTNTWTLVASGTTDDIFGVWGSDANNVWAVARRGTIRKWNGTSWTLSSSGTTVDLADVAGVDATHVWAVGAAGTIASSTLSLPSLGAL